MANVPKAISSAVMPNDQMSTFSLASYTEHTQQTKEQPNQHIAQQISRHTWAFFDSSRTACGLCAEMTSGAIQHGLPANIAFFFCNPDTNQQRQHTLAHGIHTQPFRLRRALQ